jgi:ferredoxin
MNDRGNSIQKIARKLLEEKKVDLVIGFEEGSTPLRATPVFVRTPEDAEKLTWNHFCWNNLAYYLTVHTGKVAVVAKGCDVRSILGHIKENQLKREDVTIIGVPCSGMVSHRLLEKRFGSRRIEKADVDGQEITVSGPDFSETIPLEEVLMPNCIECCYPAPVEADYMVEGNARDTGEEGRSKRIAEFEAKTDEERWDYFKKEVSRCIRCYACRNVCPLCYCKECFVDHTMPRWLNTTLRENDLEMYQIVRVFHTAGRCVDCGSCAAVCPMGIDIRLLTKKIGDDVKELFGYEAGLDTEGKPPLQSYAMEDSNEGFL